MKKYLKLFCFLVLTLACKKQDSIPLCLKIKVIGYDYCNPSVMGAQIVDGPSIGEKYQIFENVISLYNMDKTRFSPGKELYVKVRNIEKNDPVYTICLALYASINFSKIQKWAISSSETSCQ